MEVVVRFKPLPILHCSHERSTRSPQCDSLSRSGMQVFTRISVLCRIGYMPDQYGHGTPEEEARLLYVAMTQAMEQLIIICHSSSEFTTRLKTALGKVAAKVL
jgi:superfamily I DNA/RNA helicase